MVLRGFLTRTCERSTVRVFSSLTPGGSHVHRVEPILALLTNVCPLKQASQRTWDGLKARLAYTMALFNILVLWDGMPVDADGNIHLSIAEFSL
jgi:hypothetical protein